MKKILIVKTSSIGDVIQAFPVLNYLRWKFPHATIDWMVEKNGYDLLSSHPELNEAISIDTKKWRRSLFSKENRQEIKAFFKRLSQKKYDLLFDLQGNSKSALFTMMANAKEKVGYGFQSVPEKPNLLATKQRFNISPMLNVQVGYLQLVQRYFNDADPFVWKGIQLKLNEMEEKRMHDVFQSQEKKPIFMICFGSYWSNKRLTEETLVAFLKLIDQQFSPSFLFIFGNEEEKRIATSLENLFPKRGKALGELSLCLWQRIMGKVDCVFTMDSASLHLCATTSTPSFSVFGPSSSLVYKPIGEHHRAFQGVCPYSKTFDKRCPILRTCETGACMKELNAHSIFKAFSDFRKCISNDSEQRIDP